jgi:hypothetical protein
MDEYYSTSLTGHPIWPGFLLLWESTQQTATKTALWPAFRWVRMKPAQSPISNQYENGQYD